jgi:hypothetical protein
LTAGILVNGAIDSSITDSKINEGATVEFTEPVKLLGVFLHGQYRIEHDEAVWRRAKIAPTFITVRAS